MKRAVLFDTETTGLDPRTGDRVLEIAAVELIDDLPTGRHYHVLLDPERGRAGGGVARARLYARPSRPGSRSSPPWSMRSSHSSGDDPLVAHNAPFDFGFLDAELARLDLPPLDRERMVDTLELARARFPGLPKQPGQPVPALRHRPGRTHHAQRAARLPAARAGLSGTDGRPAARPGAGGRGGGGLATVSYAASTARRPRLLAPDAQALQAHALFVAKLKDAVWLRAG